MITIFCNFLKNRSYLYWLIVCSVFIYLSYEPLFGFNISYLSEHQIPVSSFYLLNAFVLPSVYFNNTFLLNIALDICYLCLLLYPILQMISYFFNEAASIIILKIGRTNWLFSIFKISLGYCLLMILFYFGIGICISFHQFHTFAFDTSILIVLVLKFLFSYIAILIYILMYIVLNHAFSATFISSMSYIAMCFITHFLTFRNNIFIIFPYSFIIVGLLILSILLLTILIVKKFPKQDILRGTL